MCIAVLKPRGIDMLTKEQMEICWENNPDGAGFAYNDGEKVYAHKGFMKFDDFYKKLMEVAGNIDLKEHDVLLHFRIATHGGINQECTHPFPVTNNIEEMKYLNFTCPVAFAHNGILTGYGSTKDGYSDTMEYNAKVISQIKHLKEQDKLIDALAYDNNSRFVLLFKDYYILGGDWVEKDGVAYSNTTYQKRVYVPVAKYYDYNYLYDDYDYYGSKKTKKTVWHDTRTVGRCDYCGASGKLYTDNSFWLCKDCMEYEKKYDKTL